MSAPTISATASTNFFRKRTSCKIQDFVNSKLINLSHFEISQKILFKILNNSKIKRLKNKDEDIRRLKMDKRDLFHENEEISRRPIFTFSQTKNFKYFKNEAKHYIFCGKKGGRGSGGILWRSCAASWTLLPWKQNNLISFVFEKISV